MTFGDVEIAKLAGSFSYAIFEVFDCFLILLQPLPNFALQNTCVHTLRYLRFNQLIQQLQLGIDIVRVTVIKSVSQLQFILRGFLKEV